MKKNNIFKNFILIMASAGIIFTSAVLLNDTKQISQLETGKNQAYNASVKEGEVEGIVLADGGMTKNEGGNFDYSSNFTINDPATTTDENSSYKLQYSTDGEAWSDFEEGVVEITEQELNTSYNVSFQNQDFDGAEYSFRVYSETATEGSSIEPMISNSVNFILNPTQPDEPVITHISMFDSIEFKVTLAQRDYLIDDSVEVYLINEDETSTIPVTLTPVLDDENSWTFIVEGLEPSQIYDGYSIQFDYLLNGVEQVKQTKNISLEGIATLEAPELKLSNGILDVDSTDEAKYQYTGDLTLVNSNSYEEDVINNLDLSLEYSTDDENWNEYTGETTLTRVDNVLHIDITNLDLPDRKYSIRVSASYDGAYLSSSNVSSAIVNPTVPSFDLIEGSKSEQINSVSFEFELLNDEDIESFDFQLAEEGKEDVKINLNEIGENKYSYTFKNLEEGAEFADGQFKIEFNYVLNGYFVSSEETIVVSLPAFKTINSPEISFDKSDESFTNSTYKIKTNITKDVDGVYSDENYILTNGDNIIKNDDWNFDGEYLTIDNLQYGETYGDFSLAYTGKVGQTGYEEEFKTEASLESLVVPDASNSVNINMSEDVDYHDAKGEMDISLENLQNDIQIDELIYAKDENGHFVENTKGLEMMIETSELDEESNLTKTSFNISGLNSATEYSTEDDQLYLKYKFNYDSEFVSSSTMDISGEQSEYVQIPKFKTKSDTVDFEAPNITADTKVVGGEMEMNIDIDFKIPSVVDGDNKSIGSTLETIELSYDLSENEPEWSLVDEADTYNNKGVVNSSGETEEWIEGNLAVSDLTNSTGEVFIDDNANLISNIKISNIRPNTIYNFNLKWKTSSSSEFRNINVEYKTKPLAYYKPDRATFKYEFSSIDEFNVVYDISNDIEHYQNANLPAEISFKISESEKRDSIQNVTFETNEQNSGTFNLADKYDFKEGMTYSVSFDKWSYGEDIIMEPNTATGLETVIDGTTSSSITMPIYPVFENNGHWLLIAFLILIILGGTGTFLYYQNVYLKTGSWAWPKKGSAQQQPINRNGQLTAEQVATKFGLNISNLTKQEVGLINEVIELEKALKNEKMLAVSEKANQSNSNRKSEQLHELKGQNDILKKLIKSIEMYNLTLNAGGKQLEANPHSPEAQTLKQWLTSFEGITGMMAKDLGLTIINPSKGESFDVNLHKVNKQEPAPGMEDGKILLTEKVGYKTDNSVLKPAEVIIVKN